MEKTTSRKKSTRSPVPKLHTRLRELESEISDLFRLSSSNRPQINNYPLFFEDVSQRIEFVKNLYTAEINTSPDQRNSEKLNEVWERIVKLENAFVVWHAAQGEASHDNVGHAAQGEVSHDNVGPDDSASICDSCTQKLFVKDGEDSRPESGSSVFPPEHFPMSAVDNVLFEEDAEEKGLDDIKEEMVVVTRRTWGGRCRVFCSGVIVGAIGVVMCLSSFDVSQEQVFFHLPPT